jgi:hypothetical protein
MKVLVVGQGGREHALAWKLSQNPTIDRLFAAPGNAGIAEVATCEPIAAADVPGLAEFAEREARNALGVNAVAGPLERLGAERRARPQRPAHVERVLMGSTNSTAERSATDEPPGAIVPARVSRR